MRRSGARQAGGWFLTQLRRSVEVVVYCVVWRLAIWVVIKFFNFMAGVGETEAPIDFWNNPTIEKLSVVGWIVIVILFFKFR